MWSRIELRELQVFLTVAEELHFGRAADRLEIKASRVSQTVRELEVKLGGRLFERTSRRVELSPLGERLLASAGPLYDQLQRAFDDVHEAAAGVSGALRVGTYLRMICGPHWREIVQAFTARHPACEVKMVDTGYDRNCLDDLRKGLVEMLAARLPVSDADMTIGPILSHEQRVLLVAKHDLLARRESISYEEIGDRAVTDTPAMPREVMDAFVPPVTASGRRLRRINQHSFEEMMMLVAAGEVVHPTVASSLRYFGDTGVVAVPISDLPPSETALVWLTANRSVKIQAFLQAAGDVVQGRA